MDINVEILEYYEKEEYIEDSRRFALSNKKLRESIIRKYFPLRNILELGCSSGVLKDIHPNYVGLDISNNALKNLNGKGVQCDIQNLPIQNESFDMICSFNVLEHVHNPEIVLKECSRMLCSDGILILGDAWNCERNISLWNKIIRFVLFRFINELRLMLRFPIKLYVKQLKPDYSKIGSDFDAISSMDHHNVVCWLKAHKWVVLSKWNRKTNFIEAKKDNHNETRI